MKQLHKNQVSSERKMELALSGDLGFLERLTLTRIVVPTDEVSEQWRNRSSPGKRNHLQSRWEVRSCSVFKMI